MASITDHIIQIPDSLSSTEIYQLLTLFENAIMSHFSIEYTKSLEYLSVKDALDYLYNGEEDEDIRKINLEYLSALVTSGKMTRRFFQILFNPSFNIMGDIDTVLSVSSNNPYNLEINLESLSGESPSVVLRKLEKMFNFLLYYHSLLLVIFEFTANLEFSLENKPKHITKDLNSIILSPL